MAVVACEILAAAIILAQVRAVDRRRYCGEVFVIISTAAVAICIPIAAVWRYGSVRYIGISFDIDVHTEYCDGFMVYEGREDAVEFLQSCMLPEQVSTHLGHCFQIDIIDETHAKAKVYLEDNLINFLGHTNQHGTALYDDEFIKRDGKWYISKIGYERVYEEQYARNEYNSGHVGNVQYLKKAGYDVDEMQKR